MSFAKFPAYLKPENEKKFSSYAHALQLRELRKAITLHLLTQDTKKGIDLRLPESQPPMFQISNSFSNNHRTIDEKLVAQIRKELHKNNWKTHLGYGNTTLFIYKDDSQKPKIQEVATEIE